jgi:hypothetical protein
MRRSNPGKRGSPLKSSSHARREANAERIPGLRIETWGTQFSWDGQTRATRHARQ